MLRFLPYVLKNLWRHRARTLLTVSGSAVALVVFCFIASVQEGLADLTRRRQSERTLIVFQANRFCPSTSRMPDHYARTIAKIPGVKEVFPIQVFMNNCRASLDLVVFHGVPVTQLTQVRNLKVVEGSLSEFQAQRRTALVGRSLARRRGLTVGKPFSVGPASVTIAGIFTSELASEENLVYCHLELLQYTPGLHAAGTVTQFEVFLNEGVDSEEICKQIDAMYRAGPIATDTRTKGVFEANAVGDLIELIGFTHYLGLACVGLVLALVATTTVMAVQDRVREHALLQTLGFPPPLIFRLVVAESALVGAIGGLLGVFLAMAALWWSGMAIGTEGVSISFLPSITVALKGLAVALAVGIGAGLIPAVQAARADIVASLRAV